MIHPLFCKPNSLDESAIICNGVFENESLYFKSMTLSEQLPEIHRWVNLPYAQRFWNMKGSYGLLQACYQCILQNPFAHSLVGYYGDKLYCQLDIYQVAADELASFVEVDNYDTGFHLIMAPIDKENLPKRGITLAFLNLLLTWYFSFPEAKKLWAEPDISNERSIRLLRLLGFHYLKTVRMSYKEAHIYYITRDDFFSQRTANHI